MSNHLRCLGGGVLRGRRLVRLAYFDESGVGTVAKEPDLVVAGVIIHGDLNRKASDALRTVKVKHSSEAICHAKDIFAGKCTGGDRDKGLAYLRAILALPDKHDMAVIWGVEPRPPHVALYPNTTAGRRDAKIIAHKIAFVRALCNAESWVRVNCDKTEYAQLHVEHSEMDRHLAEMFAGMRTGSKKPIGAVKKLLANEPLCHFSDPPYFARKGDDVPLLQIADACAYAIRARLAGAPESETLIKALRPRMWPSADITWPPLKPAKARRA